MANCCLKWEKAEEDFAKIARVIYIEKTVCKSLTMLIVNFFNVFLTDSLNFASLFKNNGTVF